MTEPAAYWPPFGLTLTTPRLELRPIRDGDIPAAVEAALSGVHEPGRNPFSNPWTEAPPHELGTNMAQWYWRCRGGMTPEDWTLLLGIWHEDQFVGCQDIAAKDFATLKTVTTGSWLRQSAQGRGLGKEMRAAVALYAFDHLGADLATPKPPSGTSSPSASPAPSATSSTASPAPPGAARPKKSKTSA